MKFPPTAPDAETAAGGGTLRVLGIDPGLADVGWGAIECGVDGLCRLIDYGVIRTGPEAPLPERLGTIHGAVGELMGRIAPRAVAVEQLYFAKNVKTAMIVAHGRAACILAIAGHSATLREPTPLQIKQALTGHGRAGKRQVQAMVRALLGLAEVPRPDHAADALAAALCHIHMMGLEARMESALAAALGEDTMEPDPRKALLMQARSRRRGRRG